jgi:hypothetical protein
MARCRESCGPCGPFGFRLSRRDSRTVANKGGIYAITRSAVFCIDKLVQQRWLLKDDAEKLKAEFRTK